MANEFKKSKGAVQPAQTAPSGNEYQKNKGAVTNPATAPAGSIIPVIFQEMHLKHSAMPWQILLVAILARSVLARDPHARREFFKRLLGDHH